MSKFTVLFRLTFIVLLAGAGLNACTDPDQGRANSAWDKGLAAYEIGDYVTALREWQPLAEQGNANAQLMLGVVYHRGRSDFKTATRWYRRAAEQGNAEAQFNLGWMYRIGNLVDVPQDEKAAAQWFRRAAEQGHADAQYNLGSMYYDGEGVPQDMKAAGQWFRRAAKQGNPHALWILPHLTE